jgi:hypothetical protein
MPGLNKWIFPKYKTQTVTSKMNDPVLTSNNLATLIFDLHQQEFEHASVS